MTIIPRGEDGLVTTTGQTAGSDKPFDSSNYLFFAAMMSTAESLTPTPSKNSLILTIRENWKVGAISNVINIFQ